MKTAVLLVTASMIVSGCAMPAKTVVTKDGFTARQKTVAAHRAIVEDYDVYRTDCRYDQLTRDKDGEYYCPSGALKDDYNSRVYLATSQQSVLETYGPALLTGAAIVTGAGLMMHGLQTQRVSPGGQFNTNEYFSTKCTAKCF
jgi:hypothetical protein